MVVEGESGSILLLFAGNTRLWCAGPDDLDIGSKSKLKQK